MSTSEKQEKPLKERLSESMDILTKVKGLGIPDTEPGYKELSAKFSQWVKDGEPWSGHIDFHRFNRRAQVILPKKAGTPAKCNLLHFVF